MLNDTSIWNKYWKKTWHTYTPLTHEHKEKSLEREKKKKKNAGPLDLENLLKVIMEKMWHATEAEEET